MGLLGFDVCFLMMAFASMGTLSQKDRLPRLCGPLDGQSRVRHIGGSMEIARGLDEGLDVAVLDEEGLLPGLVP